MQDRYLVRTLCMVLSLMMAPILAEAQGHPAGVASAANGADVWTLVPRGSGAERPLGSSRFEVAEDHYGIAILNEAAIRSILDAAPREGTAGRASGVILTLPMPNGGFSRFRVEASPIMEPELAARFPELQTFRGQGIDDPTATLRCDLTPLGFHGQILSALGTVYLDPLQAGDTTRYITYDKSGLRRPVAFSCQLDEATARLRAARSTGSRFQSSDGLLRTFRLALACTGEYAAAVCSHNGVALTVDNTMAAMTTTMNRVNGVYERELSIHMNLVANNTALVFTDASTDPYSNSNASSLLSQNQATCDSRIGSANYDIGHVFSTGGGGLAGLGVVCESGYKAQGETGSPAPYGDAYDIDYVAHEMGHQFGANHTFISSQGSCSGNGNAATAFERGSGVTIMAYAGICGSEDLAAHSYDYFHTASLNEITDYLASVGCAQTTVTGNQIPSLAIGANYTGVPVNTPFILTVQGASDPDGDALSYCWEDWQTGANCLFRPLPLSTSPSRTFPQMADVLSGAATPWETLPNAARTMTFRCTIRDNHAGSGTFTSAAMSVDFVAGPFSVSSPNTAVSWAGYSTQTITWVKGGSVSTNVKVSLSLDGGATWTPLLASTPNDGSETVTVPNTPSAACRIKVEPTDNIYFDVSNVNFTITASANTNPTISAIGDQNLAQNAVSAAIPFTLGDQETSTANLTLTAASSNLALMPLAGIQFGGTGANRTVTFAPAANQIGTSDLQITVTDLDGGTQSTVFKVTVANVAPNARAKNIAITAPTQPVYAAGASVDNGSSDPDGNSISLVQSPAGPYLPGVTGVTLTVSDTHGASAQAAATVTVTQVPSTLTLASSGASRSGDTVTFTAQASSLFGTPAGTVTFLDGTSTLGTGTLVNGLATFATSALSVGNHSITARYEGATHWAIATSSTINQSVTLGALVLSGGPASLSVAAGASGTTSFTLDKLGAPTGPVSFTVSGLPTAATCEFSRSTIPVGELPAVIQVQIKTTKSLPRHGAFRSSQGLGAGALLACGLLVMPGAGRKRRRMMFLSGLLAVMLGGLMACHSSRQPAATPASVQGTPAGTYLVTLTAQASGAEPASATLQLTVTP